MTLCHVMYTPRYTFPSWRLYAVVSLWGARHGRGSWMTPAIGTGVRRKTIRRPRISVGCSGFRGHVPQYKSFHQLVRLALVQNVYEFLILSVSVGWKERPLFKFDIARLPRDTRSTTAERWGSAGVCEQRGTSADGWIHVPVRWLDDLRVFFSLSSSFSLASFSFSRSSFLRDFSPLPVSP